MEIGDKSKEKKVVVVVVVVVAGIARGKGKVHESSGIKKQTQKSSFEEIKGAKRESMLEQSEQERIEEIQKATTPYHPKGDDLSCWSDSSRARQLTVGN